MRMRSSIAAMAVMLVAGVEIGSPQRTDAQDNRLRVSFGAAATTGGPESEPALTGSVGYRFAERLSFEVEVTAFEGGDRDFPFTIAGAGGNARRGNQLRLPSGQGIGPLGSALTGINLAIFPPIQQDVDSETILATLGFRYEFPVQAGRLLPYVTAGFGAARTERTFEYGPVPLAISLPRIGLQAPMRFQSETVTRTGFAASLGIGASVRVAGQLFVDGDARYFRLDNDRSIGRFGGGVSYRF
jgi:opacity protein-like surface antigen